MHRLIQCIKNIFHLFEACIAVVYFRFPSRNLTVIGVTGTDGKTTTANLIYHILKVNNCRVSMISTVSAVIGDIVYDTGFHVTTPSPFAVQRFLRQAVDAGSTHFILETTSHALDQYRVFGIRFLVSVITNISHEHLHYHGTYQNYVTAKAKLMKWSNITLLNSDDDSYPYLKKLVGDAKVMTYGYTHRSDFSVPIEKKLDAKLAKFNTYNYLASYGVCTLLKIPDDVIIKSMKTYVLPVGRLEVVHDHDFTVIVDFAHTPRALYEVLSSIREKYGVSRRLVHIFGAAAKRDDAKRVPMGEASATFSDLIILTEEDHRDEDPQSIARHIAQGVAPHDFSYVEPDSFGDKVHTYTIITNRAHAVQKAISIARKGDVIVLTGKGHEKSLNRYGVEHTWSDKGAVEKCLSRKST